MWPNCVKKKIISFISTISHSGNHSNFYHYKYIFMIKTLVTIKIKINYFTYMYIYTDFYCNYNLKNVIQLEKLVAVTFS